MAIPCRTGRIEEGSTTVLSLPDATAVHEGSTRHEIQKIERLGVKPLGEPRSSENRVRSHR